MAGAAGIAVIALIVTLSVQAAVGRSDGPAWVCPAGATPPRTPGSITFFVIGDWGRKGVNSQKKVAKMMATVADCMPPAFIISTGDNFYSHGLTSPSDPAFRKSFTDVYSDSGLQVPWYAVLGNHDYGDGIDPDGGPNEVNSDCAANTLANCPEGCCYSSVWQFTGRPNDARWHLQNGTYAVPTGAAQLLDILMVDTNPFITRYKDEPWFNNAGGVWQQSPDVTKAQLRKHLSNSGATWKLVVGHHPIASFGSHCQFKMGADCKEMSWLEPELQAAKVAAYLSGHDHDLQHIVKLSDPSDDNSAPVWPHYVVSGAGSETRANEKKSYKGKEGYSMEYMTDDSGFVAVQANASHLAIYFFGESRAEPAHTEIIKAPAVRAVTVPQPQPTGAAAGLAGLPRQGMAVPAQSALRPAQHAGNVQPAAAAQPVQPAAAAAAVAPGAGQAAVVAARTAPMQPAQAAAAVAATRATQQPGVGRPQAAVLPPQPLPSQPAAAAQAATAKAVTNAPPAATSAAAVAVAAANALPARSG